MARLRYFTQVARLLHQVLLFLGVSVVLLLDMIDLEAMSTACHKHRETRPTIQVRWLGRKLRAIVQPRQMASDHGRL